VIALRTTSTRGEPAGGVTGIAVDDSAGQVNPRDGRIEAGGKVNSVASFCVRQTYFIQVNHIFFLSIPVWKFPVSNGTDSYHSYAASRRKERYQ
jgi:hypothetical protein